MSKDRTETPTLADVIRDAIRKCLLDTRVSMPAKVLKYDPDTQKADVQPLIRKRYKTQDGTGTVVDPPVISDVPVSWESANNGAAYLTMPLKIGDIGTVKFMDRSIDEWLSGDGSMVTPVDQRIHDYSDAVFEPGLRTFKSPLTGVPADNVKFKNGNMFLEMDPTGKVKFQNSSEDLTDLIFQLAQAVEAITVMTGIGIQPIINKSTVTDIKDKIEGFKI